jgi:hypothetical protein
MTMKVPHHSKFKIQQGSSAGDGKTANLFLSVYVGFHLKQTENDDDSTSPFKI